MVASLTSIPSNFIMAPSSVPTADPAAATSLSTMVSSTASSNMSSRRSSFADTNIGVPVSSGAAVSGAASSTSLSSQGQPQQQPRRLQHTADPMMRTYPKPVHDIDVAEALAREPARWSLGYWAKNARDMPPPPAVTQERMDKMKQELRQAQGELTAHWPKR